MFEKSKTSEKLKCSKKKEKQPWKRVEFLSRVKDTEKLPVNKIERTTGIDSIHFI